MNAPVSSQQASGSLVPDNTNVVFVTQYGYDGNGNQIWQRDALGRETRFEYDALGRRVYRILPGTAAWPMADSGAKVKVNQIIGVGDLGFNAKGKSYVLLRYAPNPENGLFTLFKPFEFFPYNEFGEHGLGQVLQYLKALTPNYADFILLRDPKIKNELLQIKREYVFVNLTLINCDGCERIELIPEHGSRGWNFERYPEELETLSLPTTNSIFASRLSEAFAIAN